MLSYNWTKLSLDKDASMTVHDDPALVQYIGKGLLTLPPGRDAKCVCKDFLRNVYQYVIQRLEKHYTLEVVKSTPIDCRFTMPAIWSDPAQSKTKAAALDAGFGSRQGDTINMITEPEAAAICALKQASYENLNPAKYERP
jgi:hypothetical protein